jgi:NDP-sugar pyrophosphorylase family protein
MSKQAMIMAAGMGSRLYHLTGDKPKALVEYRGRTLLEWVLLKLQESGYHEIVINTHHLKEQIKDFLLLKNFTDLDITLSEEDVLLDTGGGLKQASKYFSSFPVLVHNVDIISDIDLDTFRSFHENSKAGISLAVKNRTTSRSLLYDSQLQLCGWRNNLTGQEIITRNAGELSPIAFSAIYFIEKAFIDFLPDKKIFPVMPEILEYSRSQSVKLFLHNDEWKDMGKLESFS